jgi:hypothetical protein
MLDRVAPPHPPLSQAEVTTALAAVGCPPYEAFVNFLTRFAGRSYSRADGYEVAFDPSTSARPPDLSGLISRDATRGTGWLLEWGGYGSAPFSMQINESGVVVLDGGIPVASTIERLIESDSILDQLARSHGRWTWARGAIKSKLIPRAENRLGIPRVAEASDDWAIWWAGTGVAANWFLEWSSGDRGEMLWVYAQTPAMMEAVLPRLRGLFIGPPAVRGWPIRSSEPDQRAW